MAPGELESTPEIRQIHISERFDILNEEQICKIDINPTIIYNFDVKCTEEKAFSESVELEIGLWKWGNNKIIVSAWGDAEPQEINFQMIK